MSNILHIENDKTILASSRIVWSEGCAPMRVVLRNNGGEFVTHLEVLDLDGGVFKHADFLHGHYFGQDDKGAMEDYLERRARL